MNLKGEEKTRKTGGKRRKREKKDVESNLVTVG